MEQSLQVMSRQERLASWSEKIMTCRNSGMSVRRWCQENGVAEKTYYLFNEAEAFAPDEEESDTVTVPEHERHKKSKKNEYTLDSIPDDMPREIIDHTLEGEDLVCPQCGDTMTEIGMEVVRKLKIKQAEFVVEEHRYHTYACQTCNKADIETPVVKAPHEKSIIPGSFGTPEAIAHIMTQKFVMGCPLYRQEQEMNRRGIKLSRQTMSNWILRATEDYLTPVYEQLHKKLLKQDVLHADETTLQVLHEPGKKPQSESYIWLYRTSGCTQKPIALYEYQPGCSACIAVSRSTTSK